MVTPPDFLESYWKSQNFKNEYIPPLIQTIFGNQLRKAWVTLNYLYKTLMPILDERATKNFLQQVDLFLQYPSSVEEHFKELRLVNLFELKLSDMGMTTLETFTGVPAPYKEISNEAFSILYNPMLNE